MLQHIESARILIDQVIPPDRNTRSASWQVAPLMALEDDEMSDLVERARLFAAKAHIGQSRKYTSEPYIVHPAAVVDLVRSVPHSAEMLAAAWLHDVVEDCGITIAEIAALFGDEVASLVGWLTDVAKPSDGNRKARRAIDRQHSAAAPAAAQTIKMADLIDNSRTIFTRDPGFARVYMGEMEALLDVLALADPLLIRMAKQQLEDYSGIIH